MFIPTRRANKKPCLSKVLRLEANNLFSFRRTANAPVLRQGRRNPLPDCVSSLCLAASLRSAFTLQAAGKRMRPGGAGKMQASSWRIVQQLGKTGNSIFSLLYLWRMIRPYLPHQLLHLLNQWTLKLTLFANPYIRISIHEYIKRNIRPHSAYAAVEAYLSTRSLSEANRLKAETVTRPDCVGERLALSIAESQSVHDEFLGAKVEWIAGRVNRRSEKGDEPENRCYTLVFHKRYRDLVSNAYLDHVIREGKLQTTRRKRQKLYTNSHHSGTGWSHIVFDHPASFEKLAMDPEKKEEIVEDLMSFKNSKDLYTRIGKAWKRGYLLYGPPGTGKSTLIAAMANLLHYDIYDLELTSVTNNKQLRQLLAEITGKSIVVIEDIDCSLDLTGSRKKSKNPAPEKSSNSESDCPGVTLSGLLNFIDGLWSSCSGERIIVFTTNHVEKLDPALIRRGRMDRHIELSYCTFEGFKVLARTYLELEEHPLFESIEILMKATEITPADVAEILMPKSSQDVAASAEPALQHLVEALQEKNAIAAGKKN
ncbi:unnamed protein product [Cuscuta epithymum]|uniref:AAA+ ATPase domain-containing protein n=2 Tax=Cuscuta epithymum TaxID=186058 RepID=A0AAV0ELQ7_9ASTE|nr:unnamed protein product [Cuscuta epithymum]